MREVETLRKREHPNIVPLLASFTSSDVESGYEEKSLNLIFPYADMNMDTWMNLNQTPPQLLGMDREGRRKYLYQSMYQLVSALSFLHREHDGMITSHHDLKPKNVLLLGGTFVICDLGSSRLIPLAQGSETDGPRGTFTYHPPEYWNEDGTRASRRHGRAFDVWSMGCILTEIATLVVFGWEMQKVREYRERRLDAPGWRQFKKRSRGQEDDSFHNHMDAVNRWVSELKETDGSRVLCDCLDIAMAMLKMTPEERLLSWEAELDFFELLYPDNPRVIRFEKGALCVQPPKLAMPPSAQTPVHRAILRGNHDRVNQLLQVGWPAVDKNLQQGEGLLVGNIVSQNTKNKDSTARYETSTDTDELESLKRAIRNKLAIEEYDTITRSRPLQELLKQKDEYGLTALHWAARFGTPSTVEFMLGQVENAVALEAKDDSGRNILHHGSEYAPESVISLILKACPDKEKLLGDKDSSGKLPLHWAAQSGNASAAKLFLESVSDPSAMTGEEDDRGNSPLQLAQKYDRVEVESVLRHFGATFSSSK
jgi:serine/threonine protein kinase